MSRKASANVSSLARQPNQSHKTYDTAPRATAEQIRIAQIYNEDDPELKIKVSEVQELTACSEEHAVMALHDSSYDVEQAVNLIYERESGLAGDQNEWQVSTKKHSKKLSASTSADNVPLNAENNSRSNHTHGRTTDESGDVETRSGNASRGRRRGGISGESRHKKDRKDRYHNHKSPVNNGNSLENTKNDKPGYSDELCDSEVIESNNPVDMPPSRRGRRQDDKWSSNRGRGASRSDRGFSSQRDSSYSGRGSWRKNDFGRGGNRGGRGGRLVVSRRDDAGVKRWQSGDDHQTHNSDVMEIDTWNNSQAALNRPEPEGWDDSGDLEGEWKGDSLIVTNSATVSESVSATKLLNDEMGPMFDHDTVPQSHTKSLSSDTKNARDAYNRMATESIKNAIGLRRPDHAVIEQSHPVESKKLTNQDPYNIILGQRHSRSKPPPPSTHIPEAPIQLAPTLQSAHGSINCQFDFGTGSFISDIKSSISADNSTANIHPNSKVGLASKNVDRKHQEAPMRSELHTLPSGTSSGDRLHRGAISDVIPTTSLDIGIQSGLVPNASNSANPSAQHGQTKIFDSTTSVSSHHHPATQQQSAGNGTSSTNAFNNSFQASQSNGGSSAKVAPTQSPFSSPMKPVSISSSTGASANFDTNSQSSGLFPTGSYQSHYSSNADNLQTESQMSKLSLSSETQSTEPSSASNIQQSNFGSHSKNVSQQQQQSSINNQMHQQVKNNNPSNNSSNVPSSGSSTAFQHLPPGIAPPLVTPHGIPFPYLNFPLDYETIAVQQRLMYELQQHNLSAPSTSSDLSNSSSSAIKSSGSLGTGSLQRSDVQSPPSTTNSQTSAAGHQLPQQGNLGSAPATLPMPFNLYYLAAAAANQPNQFYPQFIPNSAALGSLFHQTATQTPGQGHLSNNIPAQQYPQPAKPLSAFNNFGSGSLHDDLDQMGKFSGPGGLGKSGYGGVKQQQGNSGSSYHSTSMQQQAHQNELKAGSSLNSNSNSSAGANNQVVGSHMTGNAGSSGSGNNSNLPNPGYPNFALSNNYPSIPPHMYPNNAAASGTPAAFMQMPGVGGTNPGLMHHAQDSGNNRMVNTGSSSGSKQQMKTYPFWNS